MARHGNPTRWCEELRIRRLLQISEVNHPGQLRPPSSPLFSLGATLIIIQEDTLRRSLKIVELAARHRPPGSCISRRALPPGGSAIVLRDNNDSRFAACQGFARDGSLI